MAKAEAIFALWVSSILSTSKWTKLNFNAIEALRSIQIPSSPICKTDENYYVMGSNKTQSSLKAYYWLYNEF